MKKFLIPAVLTLCLLVTNTMHAKVVAYFTSAAFNVPTKQPYYETYLSVIGNSVKFVKNANGKFQGTVDVTVRFLKEQEVKSAQKYSLNSPEVADTTKTRPNFIDQQRYTLPQGMYTLEISIADKNMPGEKPLTTSIPITVSFDDATVSASDIQLLESYTKAEKPGQLTKSGYDLVPYVSTFFPENISKIKFYAEFYNAKKVLGENEKVVLSYFIENYETKAKMSEYSYFSKQAAADVNIAMGEFNIDALPSGNYNLVIELRDKDNKLQSTQTCFIQRKNKATEMSLADIQKIDVSKTFAGKYTNVDTLMGYLRCLRPISNSSEIEFTENQLKEHNLPLMQQYFYNFWKARYPLNPEQSWNDYYSDVKKVNEQFGTYGLKGYDTDRGRVYLQYGPPDTRTRMDNEPSAYPYEIWAYNSLFDKRLAITNPNNRQSNKKFVFYNPDLVTNKYMLLHSTAKGEIYNSNWELLLHKRDTPTNNLDTQTAPDHFGDNANDIFRDPR